MQAQRGANSSPNMGRWTGRVTQLTQGKQAARLESCLSYLRHRDVPANWFIGPSTKLGDLLHHRNSSEQSEGSKHGVQFRRSSILHALHRGIHGGCILGSVLGHHWICHHSSSGNDTAHYVRCTAIVETSSMSSWFLSALFFCKHRSAGSALLGTLSYCSWKWWNQT